MWAYTVHALAILVHVLALRLRSAEEAKRNALTERNFAPSTYKIELRAKLEKSDISDTLKRVAFEMQS